MGEPQRAGKQLGGIDTGWSAHPPESRSFAELLAAMNRLNALESALATAIAQARVPLNEVRRFLRSRSPAEAENAPAFQFMRELFAQVGLPLSLRAVSRFSLSFNVDASPYARLFSPEPPRKTCTFVSEALARFLGTDFGLPASVEESSCRNERAVSCRFDVALDPVAAASRALDAEDWRLFRSLAEGVSVDDLPAEERDFRMETLLGYGLVTSGGRLLPNGEALARAGLPTEDSFEPPWREVSRLTGAIAHAASAAEALVEVAPRNPPGSAPDAEVAALAAECHSFAELLARASRGRS